MNGNDGWFAVQGIVGNVDRDASRPAASSGLWVKIVIVVVVVIIIVVQVIVVGCWQIQRWFVCDEGRRLVLDALAAAAVWSAVANQAVVMVIVPVGTPLSVMVIAIVIVVIIFQSGRIIEGSEGVQLIIIINTIVLIVMSQMVQEGWGWFGGGRWWKSVQSAWLLLLG